MVLSAKEMKTIGLALSYAIEERAGYAGATTGADGDLNKEHHRAKRLMKDFEALHQKLFGSPTVYQQLRDEDAAKPRISLQELANRPIEDHSR